MRIEALEPSKRIKGEYILRLADESTLKVTDNEVVSFCLYSGQELDGEALEALKEAAGASRARSLAARLVGRRPMSRRELLQKLGEKGVREGDRESAADWLEELGALDDGSYARTVVWYYSQRGYGPKRLEQELFRRGVPREFWADALPEAAPAEEGVDRFLQNKLRGREPNDPKEIKRVSDALLRRGYSWEQIKEGLRRYGAELEDTE